MNRPSYAPSPVGSKPPATRPFIYRETPLVYRFEDPTSEIEERNDMDWGLVESAFADIPPADIASSAWNPSSPIVSPPPENFNVKGFDFEDDSARGPSPIVAPKKDDATFKPLKEALYSTRKHPAAKKEFTVAKPMAVKPQSVTEVAKPTILKHKTVAKAAKPTVRKHKTVTFAGLNDTKRRKWSKQDDELFLKLLRNTGKLDASDVKVNWLSISKLMGNNRTAKQCRDRWQNYLRPGIKKGNWTKSEEIQIMDMYRSMGPKWVEMAKKMPNRAENDIKNKWNSMKRTEERFSKMLPRAMVSSEPFASYSSLPEPMEDIAGLVPDANSFMPAFYREESDGSEYEEDLKPPSW